MTAIDEYLSLDSNITKHMETMAMRTSYSQDGAVYFGPSLIWQLKLAISNASGSGERGTGGKKKIVISAEAFDMMQHLRITFGMHLFGDDTLDHWQQCLRWHRMKANTLGERRALEAGLRKTIERVNNLLNPPRRYHLEFPCPHCHARMVMSPDDDGVLVQRPALTIDGIVGCQCRACGALWPPDRLESLAHALGCDPL